MGLHIGTCGFSYREWVGPFYPKGTASIDMLAFYAERFSAVEIDSTYYAIPKPQLFAGMDRRTPPHFRFAVKAPGSITHIPADAEPAAGQPEAFAEALQPLIAAGKLAAVLAQFPNSFRPGADAYRRLERLREWWAGIPLSAEFRHRDWQSDATLDHLRALSVGWCNVDEPRFRSLLRPGSAVTSRLGYIRFHGRNYGEWWKKSERADKRYDYLYSEAELHEWMPRIAAVADQADDTYVFFNNHRLGKAPANATQLAAMLRMR
ncbi:MAG: DUF72 domain-containing protein [Candidatus Eremiobacteraeota bacterium]|nr:DUF72 domain-containing protein [Candidatus Eremiobacteraeota bacterium]